MGSFKDKVLGIFNIGTGRLKQGLARDTQDPGLDREGVVQEFKGRTQKTVGEVKDKIGNAFHEVGSKIKRSG